ncbi:MAG: hypothetical protein SGJ01_11620 [Gemmatimonadota bacterium]|nr:hypothetical protein [Gemmatimonadota bacterium]
MNSKPSFWKCLAAAFSARPFGMFVPPNWIALSAIGLLGLRNPGFWLIGAGVELAYLFSLATNRKFQDWVVRRGSAGSEKAFQEKQDALIARLSDTDQARYVAFVSRCRTILDQFNQLDSSGAAAQVQAEGLGKLTWVYLRLLLARRAMLRVLKDPSTSETEELQVRLDRVKARLDEKTMDEDLRKSLGSQAEILAQRVNQRSEGRDKLEFLEAEILRIQEQVELLREQSALGADADGLSRRLDEITGSLGGATEWIADQQKVYGQLDDLLDEPPPLTPRTRQKERA